MSTIVAFEQLHEVLDERTLHILERRRSGASLRRRGWFVRRALLAADMVGLCLAFALAQWLYAAQISNAGALSQAGELGAFAVSLPAWVIAAKLYGLYDKDDERTDHSTADDFIGIFHLVTVCTFFLYLASRETRWFNPEFGKLVLFWLLAVATTVGFRAIARAHCRRQLYYLQNTLIIGAGEVGQSLAQKLLNHPEYGLNLVGFVDANPRDRAQTLEHLALLGDLDDALSLVDLLDVERAIVAFTNDDHERLTSLVGALRERDVQVDIVPRLFEGLGPSVGIHPIEGIPLISVPPVRLSRSSLLVKRLLDIIVSASALVCLAPVFLVVAAAIKLDSPGPALYRHRRVGRRGAPVQLLKFRTMYRDMCRGSEYGGDSAELFFEELLADPRIRNEFDATFKLRNDLRVTSVGRFLRKSSIDELPQLWNVLRGEISLVGPRALTDEELERYYGTTASTLLSIRPGVTGYWQVNGRSGLDYEDRVRLDLSYIGGWSLGLDLKILARTLRIVLRPNNSF